MFIEANFSAKGADSTRYTAKSLTFLPEPCCNVVVEELIPEMSQGQHSNVGTVFFAVGFSVMMVLDVALG